MVMPRVSVTCAASTRSSPGSRVVESTGRTPHVRHQRVQLQMATAAMAAMASNGADDELPEHAMTPPARDDDPRRAARRGPRVRDELGAQARFPGDQAPAVEPARPASGRTGPSASRSRGCTAAPLGLGRHALVGARGAEQRRLGPGRADQLEPDRQPVGQPARDRDRRAGPAMLTGSVQASARYICTGSAIRAPNGKATVGDVGATRASKPGLPEQVEVALDQRPDLLGLEVERVVVAGRQRVRAEHDPALDLGPEALARGSRGSPRGSRPPPRTL